MYFIVRIGILIYRRHAHTKLCSRTAYLSAQLSKTTEL